MSRASRLAAVALVALVLSVGTPVPTWTPTSLAMNQNSKPATETLLDVRIDGLPTGLAKVAVERWTLRPGPRALTIPAIDGPLFIVLESGEVTATEAGTEHRLVVREPFAPADRDHEVELRPSGPETAVAWVVSLNGRLDDSIPRDLGSHTLARFVAFATEAFPGGSGRLVLERLTLPPGSALSPVEVSALMWVGIGEGAVGVILKGRTPVSWESGRGRIIQAGQPWPYIPTPMDNPLMPGGTQMTLRNASAGKILVLYRLTLTPGADDTSAAGTALSGTPLS
jgi:hypothetical protein